MSQHFKGKTLKSYIPFCIINQTTVIIFFIHKVTNYIISAYSTVNKILTHLKYLCTNEKKVLNKNSKLLTILCVYYYLTSLRYDVFARVNRVKKSKTLFDT
jgi:hypothetical protein